MKYADLAGELVTLITHEMDEVVMMEHANRYLESVAERERYRCRRAVVMTYLSNGELVGLESDEPEIRAERLMRDRCHDAIRELR